MTIVISSDTESREKFCQEVLAGHRSASRSAAAVRCGKGFVKIQMHHIESHITRTRDSHYSIQVGAVVIA